jgi:alkanesulfonate monooxygenase SsuD/methylene tetrahydromethanopterin reductase-like flavin-dependent oxidoreductase (luciferase family)
VAACTTRLRLATTSYLLPVRHPLHVAAEVAALDRLSDGRVILGVGRGFRPALFRAFGVPAEEKRDRFEAVLEAILAAWRGEPVTRDGDASAGAKERPVVLAPLPVQRPHPPVWVAGFGPKGVAQAGRLGLPYLASPLESLAALEENYARHREALGEDRRGERLAVPVMRTLFVSRNAALLDRARAALAREAAALSSVPVASLRRHAGTAVDEWALVGEPARGSAPLPGEAGHEPSHRAPPRSRCRAGRSRGLARAAREPRSLRAPRADPPSDPDRSQPHDGDHDQHQQQDQVPDSPHLHLACGDPEAGTALACMPLAYRPEGGL